MTASPWGAGVEEAYRPTRTPRLVDVPPNTFLMIDGVGDPATSAEYTDAVETLYAVAYAARFDLRRTAGVDAKVMPLEGLWATDATGEVWSSRDAWRWTMMIAVPDALDDEVFERSLATAARKRSAASLARLRRQPFAEGATAQVLHVGPYGEAERPTLELLHGFIAEQGLDGRGQHHEIYLSDARRTAPERLRTILRQPVSPAVAAGAG